VGKKVEEMWERRTDGDHPRVLHRPLPHRNSHSLSYHRDYTSSCVQGKRKKILSCIMQSTKAYTSLCFTSTLFTCTLYIFSELARISTNPIGSKVNDHISL
jgi:hypothetical protein